MIRFKYPRSAESKLIYFLDGKEHQLEPGQSLALPAGQKFDVKYYPSESSELTPLSLTEQGNFVFAEKDGAWSVEKYVAPGTKTETTTEVVAPPEEEAPSEDK